MTWLRKYFEQERREDELPIYLRAEILDALSSKICPCPLCQDLRSVWAQPPVGD